MTREELERRVREYMHNYDAGLAREVIALVVEACCAKAEAARDDFQSRGHGDAATGAEVVRADMARAFLPTPTKETPDA